MELRKIIPLILFVVLFTSCLEDNSGNSELQNKYNAVKTELDKLKARNSKNQQESIRQATLLNETLEELTTLTSKTSELRLNKELGTAEISQAQQLKNQVELIKEKISELENLAMQTNDEKYKSTITMLNRMLEEQKAEIETLKKELSDKDYEIATHKKTIKEREEELVIREITINDLEKKIKVQQAMKWFDMGMTIYRLNEDYAEGSKGFLGVNKGNFKKMQANKKSLLIEAKSCFQEAYNMGQLQALDYISVINQELDEIKN